jgi:hypothetical protein
MIYVVSSFGHAQLDFLSKMPYLRRDLNKNS